ncbi:MAG TPA: zf-HC2 domain-containing protein, partial [Pyrinomonadaceae bacterium]|nr:zf-HC2 domain-containing protein [Pyrinomonadaceae bacterium]
MDRLLRRYSRRSGQTLPGRGEGNDISLGADDTAHMDADELNAYAEGALPEAARARYFTHLADCDSCRKLVTELTLASGVVSEEKHAVVAGPVPSKSWREWLGALLSPPVLRYALPALVLFAVMIVAVVLMRARREAELVSQNNEVTDTSALKTPANAEPAGGPSSANIATGDESHSSTTTANSNVAPTESQQPPSRPEVAAAATPSGKATATEEDSPPSADASKPVLGREDVIDRKQNEFGQENRIGGAVASNTAPEPTPVLAAPPPAPPARGEDVNRNKREEQAKAKNPTKDADEMVVVTDNAGASATVSKTASNEARRDRAAKAAAPSSPGIAARRATRQENGPTDAVAEKERVVETRSVSGRQFRREGSVWVD